MERLAFSFGLLVELSLLYLVVSALVGVLTSSLTPARIRALLQGRNAATGMLGAAVLGAVTPFCSCSTVPVVAGMHKAGVPLPFVTTFLVMSPLVNPATLALFGTMAGATYTALFLAASFAVALLVGGASYLLRQDAVVPLGDPVERTPPRSWRERGRRAATDALREYAKLLPVFVLASLVGGLLHDNVAQAWIQANLAHRAWYMVPLAAVVGVPLYASTAVLLPLGTTLYASGVNLGVVTALLMGATGFSVPEAVMLRRLMGGRVLALVGAAFTSAVVLMGYLFQFLAPV